MQAELGHRATDLHKPEPINWADRFFHHSLAEVRRGAECRPDGVPDEPGPLSQNPLSPGDVRAYRLHRESLSRAADCDGADVLLLRAGYANGQMQSSEGKVHGLLPAVQGRRGTQGRERVHRDD